MVGWCRNTAHKFLALGDGTWKGCGMNSNANSFAPGRASFHEKKKRAAITSVTVLMPPSMMMRSPCGAASEDLLDLSSALVSRLGFEGCCACKVHRLPKFILLLEQKCGKYSSIGFRQLTFLATPSSSSMSDSFVFLLVPSSLVRSFGPLNFLNMGPSKESFFIFLCTYRVGTQNVTHEME